MLSTERARKSFALASSQSAPWPIYMEMLQQLLQVHKPQPEPELDPKQEQELKLQPEPQPELEPKLQPVQLLQQQL